MNWPVSITLYIVVIWVIAHVFNSFMYLKVNIVLLLSFDKYFVFFWKQNSLILLLIRYAKQYLWNISADRVVADLKHKAANEADKKEKRLFNKIEQYFEWEIEHVHYVENYKEDLLNSARSFEMRLI